MRLSSLSFACVILCSVKGTVFASCPGPLGDSFCQSLTSAAGYCQPGRWLCFGTSVACGCDFRAPTTATTTPTTTIATTRPRTTRTSLATSQSTPIPSGTSSAPTTTSGSSQTSGPVECGSSPSRPLFIWAEWPDLYDKAAYASFYSKLLGFIAANCGNFRVTKLILRVMDPMTNGLSIISTQSSLYTDFLTKLPSSVELRMYPYVLDSKYQATWGSYTGTGKPLQGVFKYTNDWNIFLANQGTSVRFGGIVLDGEEKAGFSTELGSVAGYKSTYNVPVFGIAIGFDTVSGISQYPSTDEFYLEMYDFYKVGAPQLTLLQTSASQTPAAFLATLDQETLASFVSKYNDARFQFMWSVQAKSRTSCIYPLGSSCGLKDDFGLYSAPDFGTFLDLVQAKYPQLSGKNHGLFQFSFTPVTWL